MCPVDGDGESHAIPAERHRAVLRRHQGPPRLGDTLHAWLTQDWFFDSVRWQTAAEWKARGHFRAKPW